MGPSKPNNIPTEVFKALAGAFKSYIGIKQTNGEKGDTRKDLILCVNAVVDKMVFSRIRQPAPSIHSPNLLNRLLKETATDLKGCYEKKQRTGACVGQPIQTSSFGLVIGSESF